MPYAGDSKKESIINDMRKNLVKISSNDHSGSRVLPSARFVQPYDSCKTKIPFHQVETFQQMVDNIHHIQLPSRVISLLRYRAMRMVLLNRDDPLVVTSLSSWIKSTMLREFVFHRRDEARAWRDELLLVFVEFSDDIQEGIPCIENVLTQYLTTWDGLEHRAAILSLIARWRICPFEQLRMLVLEPLRRLFFRRSTFFKCAVIECLTRLVHYMAMIELARYSCASQRRQMSAGKTSINIYFRSVFPSATHEPFDVLEMFAELIEWVGGLCDAGLRVHAYDPLLVHHTLCYYEEVAQLYQSFGIPRLVVMSAGIAYHGLFSLDPSVLSRTCILLCR